MKKTACKLAAILVIVVLLAGCSDISPAPESDSSQDFASGAKIPVDDNVYVITGEVVADVDSLTRQTEAARGSVSGYGSGYGSYVSGSYFGPQFGGKGFVRLLVSDAHPPTGLAPRGDIVIIKTSDTKASALLPGDVVTFKCRAQYEAVAAVRRRETFDADLVETWELDYCRLVSPVIEVVGEPPEEILED